jgi:hypothetical protein
MEMDEKMAGLRREMVNLKTSYSEKLAMLERQVLETKNKAKKELKTKMDDVLLTLHNTADRAIVEVRPTVTKKIHSDQNHRNHHDDVVIEL